jgi:uncharacterized protein (TIGR02453 family)
MGFKARSSRGAAGSGFSDQTIQFLADLEQNNDRDWFAENKQRYEEVVREPALAFIRALGPHLAAISPHYKVSDKKMGGSLMRVFRDTRFGADKTPYKTNIGIHVRHGAGKDVHAPGLYIHIALEGCFIGVGSWRPEPDSLAAIRQRIVDSPRGWVAARDDRTFRRYFELTGDSLVRMPRGFTDDQPHADDLRRKDHTASAELGLDTVIGSDFVGYCATRFAAATPYLRFVTRAVGAPF